MKDILLLHFDFPAKLAGQKVGLTHRALLELCTIKTVYKIDADQTALMCMLICIFVYGISMFSHDAWDIVLFDKKIDLMLSIGHGDLYFSLVICFISPRLSD